MVQVHVHCWHEFAIRDMAIVTVQYTCRHIVYRAPVPFSAVPSNTLAQAVRIHMNRTLAWVLYEYLLYRAVQYTGHMCSLRTGGGENDRQVATGRCEFGPSAPRSGAPEASAARTHRAPLSGDRDRPPPLHCHRVGRQRRGLRCAALPRPVPFDIDIDTIRYDALSYALINIALAIGSLEWRGATCRPVAQLVTSSPRSRIY